MEQEEQISDAVSVIWQKRKAIFIWSALAIFIAAPLSFLLKDYYRANTIFYPASLDLSKPDQLFGNNTREMEFYGSGQDLDRLLTICTSNQLKDNLIGEFDLYQHYKIDSSSQYAKHKIRKKLDKLLHVTKTKYDAVDLSIEDIDKELATNMTNRAREIVNSLSHDLVVKRLQDVAAVYQKSIEEKSAYAKNLIDSLYHLRKIYPIYNIKAQTETMSNLVSEINNAYVGEQARYEALKRSSAPRDTLMYLLARLKGLENQLKSLNSNSGSSFNLTTFNEGVSKISSLESSIERIQAQINEDKIKYQNTFNTIDSDAKAIITVSAAEIPDYKSRPARSVLILAAGVLTAFSMALYYLLVHYRRK